jgi:hypothetical protein
MVILLPTRYLEHREGILSLSCCHVLVMLLPMGVLFSNQFPLEMRGGYHDNIINNSGT